MYISSLSIAHPRDLVRTYNQRGQDDAWEAVRNYVCAMEYHDRYPDRTPAEVVFDAPEREWIDIGPNHPHVDAIATLVGQTIAAGRPIRSTKSSGRSRTTRPRSDCSTPPRRSVSNSRRSTRRT